MNKIRYLLFRYAFILVVSFPNLFIFYFLFTPLTIYSSYFLFSLFFETIISGNSILISECFKIEFIDACIAGSAYYLLFILNLSTPNIKIKDRLSVLFLSFFIFFIFNILRIFFLGLLLINNSPLFESIHKTLWYFGGALFVAGIWFFNVRLFKIKEIPFYSDLKFLYKKIK